MAGSQARNLPHVIAALAPLVNELPSGSRVLEIASHPYTHILAFAERWPETEWWGSVRDEAQRE